MIEQRYRANWLLMVTLIGGAFGRTDFVRLAPLAYASLPIAPLGPDGRVLDTVEVALAKAEHANAQANERLRLADEAARSEAAGGGEGNGVVVVPRVLIGVPGASAPLGSDGRVVETAEVAAARAEHAAAHANERLNLAVANQAAASGVAVVPFFAPAIGLDGRVLDTPEVAVAKVAHAAAHANERLNLANEAARSSGSDSAEGNGDASSSSTDAAPLGPDGRVVDTREVALARAAHTAAHINEKANLVNQAVKSADVVAVAAGTGLAYGRLIY